MPVARTLCILNASSCPQNSMNICYAIFLKEKESAPNPFCKVFEYNDPKPANITLQELPAVSLRFPDNVQNTISQEQPSYSFAIFLGLWSPHLPSPPS